MTACSPHRVGVDSLHLLRHSLIDIRIRVSNMRHVVDSVKEGATVGREKITTGAPYHMQTAFIEMTHRQIRGNSAGAGSEQL